MGPKTGKKTLSKTTRAGRQESAVETKKRLAVYVTPERFTRAKVAAAKRGISLSALIETLLDNMPD